MDVFDAIAQRRSTRSFEKRAIPADVIEKIESSILYSPSGSNSQESHIVVVQDEGQIRRMNRFSPGLSGEPPAIVVLCSNTELALETGGKDTVEVLRFVNLGIAASYIMLSAQSIGVGTCPIRGFHKGAIKEILDLPENIDPELMICLGYANQPPRPKKGKLNKEVISHDRYGQ